MTTYPKTDAERATSREEAPERRPFERPVLAARGRLARITHERHISFS